MNQAKLFFISVLGWAALTGLSGSVPARADCPTPPESGCAADAFKEPPPGSLAGVSEFRRKIVETAASQIGQVSVFAGSDGNKCGWQNLTDYYNAAYDQPLPARAYSKIRRPSQTRLDSAQPPKGMPSGPKYNDWCGIFALWAVKTGARGLVADRPAACGGQAGGNGASAAAASFQAIYPQFAGWRPQKKGWGIDGIPFVYGNRGLKPGDVAYFKGDLRHQAIVERVIGDRIYTIDGNQGCQAVVRQERSLSSVAGFYRVE